MRLSKEVFAKIVADRLGEVGQPAKAVRSLVLHCNAADAEVHLDALWATACRDPRWPEAVPPFARGVRRQLLLPRELEALVPLLRREDDLAEDADAIRFPFAPGLQIVLALEASPVTSFVHGRDLARWELSPEAALRTAQRLLNARTVPFTLSALPEDHRLFRIVARDTLAAARLLIGDWSTFADRLGGFLAAAVPSEDALFLTADEEAVPALRGLAGRTFASDPRPLSRQVLGWSQGRFEVIETS